MQKFQMREEHAYNAVPNSTCINYNIKILYVRWKIKVALNRNMQIN